MNAVHLNANRCCRFENWLAEEGERNEEGLFQFKNVIISKEEGKKTARGLGTNSGDAAAGVNFVYLQVKQESR